MIGNFFGGTLCVGIRPYTTDRDMDPGDNGIYVVKGWKIVERLESGWDRDWTFAASVAPPLLHAVTWSASISPSL